MTVQFDDSGFRKFRERLAKLQGAQIVPLPELFPDHFIRQYTRFQTLKAMLDAAGVKGQQDVDSPEFSEFVKANTRFENYETMCHFANGFRIQQKLGS